MVLYQPPKRRNAPELGLGHALQDELEIDSPRGLQRDQITLPGFGKDAFRGFCGFITGRNLDLVCERLAQLCSKGPNGQKVGNPGIEDRLLEPKVHLQFARPKFAHVPHYEPLARRFA